MVRLIIHDPVGAVGLLQQDYAHELVREGHVGKAQEHVGARKDCGGEAEGAPDYEADVAAAGQAQLLDFFGELHRIQLFAFDGEGDDIGIVPDFGKKTLSFLFLYPELLVFPGFIGGFLILNLYYFRLAVAGETLHIFVYRIRIELFFDLPDTKNRYLHGMSFQSNS